MVLLTWSLVVLVCPLVLLVCPLVVSFCTLVVLVVLSVSLFITDRSKVTTKNDVTDVVLVSLLITYFAPFSSVSIVDFEQINVFQK